jgi:hypothetical protein
MHCNAKLLYCIVSNSCYTWRTAKGLQTSELSIVTLMVSQSAVAYRGRGVFNPPPPELPKAHQNHAKLNPIVKPVKNY